MPVMKTNIFLGSNVSIIRKNNCLRKSWISIKIVKEERERRETTLRNINRPNKKILTNKGLIFPYNKEHQ